MRKVKSQLFDGEPMGVPLAPVGTSPKAPTLKWGAATAAERGPVIATLRNATHRNAIGTHAGGYSVYRALAIAAGALPRDHLADLTDTAPADRIGPHPQWLDPAKIVSLDPWGHLVGQEFHDLLVHGYDVRPTIAVTRAHIDVPEIRAAIEAGRMHADGDIVSKQVNVRVMKAAIDPVWYLPGIAARFGVSEAKLRRDLHEQTAGMYPQLVEREELKGLLRRSAATITSLTIRPARRRQDARGLPRAQIGDSTSARTSAPAGYLAHSISPPRWRRRAASVSSFNRKGGRTPKSQVSQLPSAKPSSRRPA